MGEAKASAISRCEANASQAVVLDSDGILKTLINSKPICPTGVFPVSPDTREEPYPLGRPELLDPTQCVLGPDAACQIVESEMDAEMAISSAKIVTDRYNTCFLPCEFKLQGIVTKAKAQGKACYVARPACIL